MQTLTSASTPAMHEDKDIQLEWHVPIVTIKLLLSLVILLVNGVIILLYCKCPQLQKGSHFPILNLAVADVLVGVMLPVNAILYFLQTTELNLCLLQLSVIGESAVYNCLQIVSLLLFSALDLDVYLTLIGHHLCEFYCG